MNGLEQYVSAGVLVAIRLSGLMVFAPVFSSPAIAPRIKAGFVFAMTILLAPVVGQVAGARAVIDIRAVAGELGVGLVFGLCLMMLTESLLMAGTLLGMTFSFSLVNLMDPNTMVETPVLGQMLGWLGVLVILGAGLDRVLLAAMVTSFRMVPIGEAVIKASTGAALAGMAGGIFLAGLQLAAPVMAAGLAVEMTISMVSRLAPSLPVQIVGIPLKTITSYVVLIGSLAVWPGWIEQHFTSLLDSAGKLLARALGSEDNLAEKGTEAGSEQHKKKARGKGDSVRSRELLSAVAMLAGVVVLGHVAGGFVHTWRVVFEQSLEAGKSGDGEQDMRWLMAFRRLLVPAMMPLGLVMFASFTGALMVGVAQGGGLEIHPNAIGMKFEKLNPMTNLANLFSLRSATRVVKSLVPAAVMVVLGWGALKELMLPMPVMSLLRLPHAFGAAYGLALDAAYVTMGWSALDYAVEWMAWNKRMKMTKQQLKDEMKESQGNPQVKGRIRQVQNAMRRRRVKADISRASVVVTNPTHYAVALEFSFETMQAPTVLAKGRDLHAAAMREEARWAGVPLIENPPLARSLYALVEPGQSIPFELYSAVAGILAFLYRQKVEEKLRAEKQRTGK